MTKKSNQSTRESSTKFFFDTGIILQRFLTFGFSSFKSRKRMYTFTKKMFDTIICVFRSKRVKKKVAINGIKAFATQEKAKD